uniref:Uncharacterized protein n=1 Tax=Brassica oleracea TaxID=3712 RepID=A0A3P6AKS7_BRAOL|nr:unnamed protein product [Brassica oleracea]
MKYWLLHIKDYRLFSLVEQYASLCRSSFFLYGQAKIFTSWLLTTLSNSLTP